MDDIRTLGKKTIKTLKEGGVFQVAKKSVEYIKVENIRRKYNGRVYKDVLFINGCDYNSLPHPPRYRIQHQMEQLRANGIECDEANWVELDLNAVRNYRLFIIFRCQYDEKIEKFIRLAHSLNKRVVYDIDDLVIDTKYTDEIKYLNTFDKQQKKDYDLGVMNMQRVLKMCDAAITTTERLAEELKKYNANVFINRNVASEKMYELSEKAYEKRVNQKQKKEKFAIGYFSGSITHNDDFELVLPVISKLMRKYPKLELHIVGLLDIPNELKCFQTRIIAHKFVNWQELPDLIAAVDVNLVPLQNNIFNEAKSENKWVEAALVRVPTVASNVGALKRMIKHEETGLLCNDKKEWYEALVTLIENEEIGKRIGENAYSFCKKNCLTLYTGMPLVRIVKKLFTPNIAFVLPALNISGGVMVALEHCVMLKKAGYDVTIINTDIDNSEWCKFHGVRLPVIASRKYTITGSLDKVVATMWFTVRFLEGNCNIKERYYLVQGFEPDMYEPGSPFRLEANEMYSPKSEVRFVTISKWCEKWLQEKYDKKARYIRNGMHVKDYWPIKRDFSGKVRILIEGDCGVAYKNVDESFQITNQLDKNKYEICYMSYNAEPKDWYDVDEFYHKVPFEEVADIYRSCHILLKTSTLESFSYPPLEMMATGGFVVAIPNGGNKEILTNEKNCLLYHQGDILEGVNAIKRICSDEDLRNKLYEEGLKTAKERDWNNIRNDVLEAYGCKER